MLKVTNINPTALKVQRWQQHSPTLPESPFHIQVSTCTLVLVITLTCFPLVSEYINEQGETRAQEVAAEYARRNTLEIPPVPSMPSSAISGKDQQDFLPGDRTSTASRSVAALTYIDEDFIYYSSKRQQDSPTDHPTAPLVAHAERRQDLGTDSPLSDLPFIAHFSIEYADPYQQQKNARGGIFGKIFKTDAKSPIEQQVADKQRGLVRRQQRPYLGWYPFLIFLQPLSDSFKSGS